MASLKICRKTSIDSPRSSPAWSRVRRFNCAAAKAISLLILACAPFSSRAIILYGTADTEANTTAPAADLASNGWDLQGNWSFFLGTPIGPHHFITAGHVGGNVGDAFTFRGVNYTTVSTTADPASDLRIWEVAGTFPAWAELYDGTSETGADLVVFGRGGVRGAEVRVNGALKGWEWGGWDGRMRWGRNKITSIISDPNHSGSADPQVLGAEFNNNATADEAHLAGGDSGGGVFIKQNTTWRLAGINYSVDGPYSTTLTGPGFNGAIFDEGGLFQGSDGKRTLTPDLPTNQAGSFYATRIKARLIWIQTVLAAPLTPQLVEASTVTGPYNVVNGAVFDTTAKTIRFTPSAGTHFYQIEGIPAKIISSELNAGTLTLRYQ